MADLLSIGLSGLRSAQTALTVTGHNITNVNTPGYSRQESVQQTNIAQFTGAGYIGSGSQVVDVRRLASDFLTNQVRTATSSNSELQSFQSQIEQLDSLLSNSTTGISPALQKFFASLQTASQDPSSTAAREAVLSQAAGLSSSFNTMYDQLDKQNSLINQQMGALTTQVNSLASSVASYNDAIARARGTGAEPNDLLDAREETIRKISEIIGVQSVEQTDGSVSLFVGTGQPLVVGNTASTLTAKPGVDDPSKYQIDLSINGVSQTITSQITGGEMGGLLAYRDTVLDKSYNSLGQMATVLADTVNKQLGQGLDLAGRAGSPLFTDINDPTAAGLRVLPAATNTGNATGSMNITNSSLLTTSDYKVKFDGTNYTAQRLSDGAAMTVTPTGTGTFTLQDPSTTPPTDQGFEVTINGTANAGDSFTLQPTRRGASDFGTQLQSGDQLALAGSARAVATTNNRGTGTISQPDLKTGPSPIDVTDLQDLFGTGLPLTFDSTTNTLTGTLPAGATLSYVSPSTTALTPGQSNTLRLDYTDPSTNNTYSYEFTVNGTPQSGDTFTLNQNTAGIADNRNALKLIDLQTQKTVGVGAAGTGATYNNAYSGLVERVGSLTAQVRVNADAAETVLTQAQNNRDSLSAVSLDEEAANLVQFQQYYNASAQVIKVAQSLFDTLIGAFN